MFRIANPLNPNRIKVIWQSINGNDRTKYHVADLIRAGYEISLFYRVNDLDFVSAISAGFFGYPAFDIRRPVHHVNVLQILLKRLPPRNRNDFGWYLEKNGLSNVTELSDFALLGYTGGRLPSDGFSFEIDFSYELSPFDMRFVISGFRYYQGMQLDISNILGHPIIARQEPNNQYDSNAVELYYSVVKLGYVPRTLSRDIVRWSRSHHVNIFLDRIEGAPAKPSVFAYLSVLPQVSNQISSHAY